MDYKTVSVDGPQQPLKSAFESMAITRYMSEASLLRIAALVSRLSGEGLQESGVISALMRAYPQYALLIQETLQALDDDLLLSPSENHRHHHPTHGVMRNEVRSQDGERHWYYEYPRGAEPVHAGGHGFTVYAAPTRPVPSFLKRRLFAVLRVTRLFSCASPEIVSLSRHCAAM